MFGWFRKYIRKIGIFGVEVEFHPPSVDPHTPIALPPSSAGVGASVPIATPVHGERTVSVTDASNGKSFDEVIHSIREVHPEAPLGRTAEQGQFFERAKGLTSFQMYEDNPSCYFAIQPNGRIMWLYLGKGGKICCGDKE